MRKGRKEGVNLYTRVKEMRRIRRNEGKKGRRMRNRSGKRKQK